MNMNRPTAILAIIFCALFSARAADTSDTLDSVTVDTMPPIADSAAVAPDSAQISPPGYYDIAIDRIRVDNMRLNDTIPVWIETNGRTLAGFDFKIALNNRAVDITDILPGYLHDSCNWKYFNARRLETARSDGYPNLIWQIVGLADVIPDSAGPTCHTVEGRVPLMHLVLSNEHMREVRDQKIPIYFFWEDCSDNTISDRSGNSLSISRRLYSYYENPTAQKLETSAAFPNRTGAPHGCIDLSATNPLQRLIDFRNGGVEFELAIPEPSGTTMTDSASVDTTH